MDVYEFMKTLVKFNDRLSTSCRHIGTYRVCLAAIWPMFLIGMIGLRAEAAETARDACCKSFLLERRSKHHSTQVFIPISEVYARRSS
jgi:hypothetical protein